MVALSPERPVETATRLASPLLSARELLGLPVLALDGFGEEITVAEMRELYFTPDRQRLFGAAVFRSGANCLGGGELLWLPEIDIAHLTPQGIYVASSYRFREFDLSWRTDLAPHRFEMLRARLLYPSEADIPCAKEIDLQLEPGTRCVMACTRSGRPASLVPSA
jgi:hypothetical protein